MTKVIVNGIFMKGGSFLVEKRKKDEDIYSNSVCIPGGHAEEGETPEEALAREMKEELNVDIRDFSLALKEEFKGYELYYFLVSGWLGELKAKTAESIFWEADTGKLTEKVERRIVSNILKKT